MSDLYHAKKYNYSDLIPSTDLRTICTKRKYDQMSDEEFDIAFVQYQKFMLLEKYFPKMCVICPNSLTDDLWHTHMLDPVNYYDDCMKWFGYIKSHDQSIACRDGGHLEILKMCEMTKVIWNMIFGEEYLYDESIENELHVSSESHNQSTNHTNDMNTTNVTVDHSGHSDQTKIKRENVSVRTQPQPQPQKKGWDGCG